MPTQSPHRITLTLPPELHATLKRAADSYGKPVATIAISMLTNAHAKLGELVDEADKLKELEAAFARTCAELPSSFLSSSKKPATAPQTSDQQPQPDQHPTSSNKPVQQALRPAQRPAANDPSLGDDREAVLSLEPAEGRIPHSDLTSARRRILVAIGRGSP